MFKKKLVVAILGVTLAVSTTGIAMADVTSDQLEAIKNWHQQRVEQRAEVLQTYVDSGRITAEQKQQVLDRMEENFKAREAAGFEGCRAIQPDGTFQPPANGQGMGLGLGPGCGKGFRGGMRGAGAGFGQGLNR